MTDRELMQQALDALEKHILEYETIEALRARLAQPEPEPVAWFSKRPNNTLAIKIVGKPTEGDWEPLYTAPPQRKEWVGLTAKDLAEIPASCFEGAIWADAKLREKNT